MDPRGFPTSLPEFQKVFPDNQACKKYLESVRWPDGFICPHCAQQGEPFRLPDSEESCSVVLKCRACRKGTSLTAGTVMQSSHTPLSTWFWAAYLVTTQTPGQSALQFQRQLGLSRYETAFQILHKLRAGMVRPERDMIGGEHPVEVDECYVGGASRGVGTGNNDMAIVSGAVEVRPRKQDDDRKASPRQHHQGGKPLRRTIYAGRLRLRVSKNRTQEAMCDFVKCNITSGSTIRTDAWTGYDPLKSLGYIHHKLAVSGDPEKAEAHLPMIHIVFSNLKAWLLGTHHGRIERHHLQAYLNEFVFRFNRRFYPMTGFNSVLGLASRSVPPTYEELYSGEWQHPAG